MKPADYHLECLECGSTITDRYTNICPHGHDSLLRTVYKRKQIRQLPETGIFKYIDWLPVANRYTWISQFPGAAVFAFFYIPFVAVSRVRGGICSCICPWLYFRIPNIPDDNLLVSLLYIWAIAISLCMYVIAHYHLNILVMLLFKRKTTIYLNQAILLFICNF